MMLIRPEEPADRPAIYQITAQAFGQPNEANLIDKLRQSPSYVPDLSLVAVDQGLVCGHLLLTRIDIVGAGQHRWPSLALAPMSVHPSRQRQGIGSMLVTEGLRRAGQVGFRSVIVLGHPAYYPKFGFQPASLWGIKCPFPAPDEAFMALELIPGALAGVEGVVRYDPAFAEV